MFDNIFILCTGRCGSTTLFKACKNFLNYTSGHETRTSFIGAERFMYPRKHIEADNRLAWLLGRLDETYGDSPLYVHLERDRDSTARSFAKRKGGIISAYQGNGIIMGCKESDQFLIARDYVDTVTSNIKYFLSNKKNVISFQLENARSDFVKFATTAGAKGDLDLALSEFDTKHNAS